MAGFRTLWTQARLNDTEDYLQANLQDIRMALQESPTISALIQRILTIETPDSYFQDDWMILGLARLELCDLVVLTVGESWTSVPRHQLGMLYCGRWCEGD